MPIWSSLRACLLRHQRSRFWRCLWSLWREQVRIFKSWLSNLSLKWEKLQCLGMHLIAPISISSGNEADDWALLQYYWRLQIWADPGSRIGCNSTNFLVCITSAEVNTWSSKCSTITYGIWDATQWIVQNIMLNITFSCLWHILHPITAWGHDHPSRHSTITHLALQLENQCQW